MDSSDSAKSDLRSLLDRVSDLLCETRWFGAIAVIVPLLVMVFRNGLGLFPEPSIKQHLAMAYVFPDAAPLPPDSAFLYNSMTGAVFAHFLGISTPKGWVVMSMVGLVIAIAVIGLMAAHAAGRAAVGITLAAFAAAGISTVMLGWIGSYDVYTVIGLTVVALSKNWWLGALGAFIVGTNSFEIGMVAIVALAVLGWADGKHRLIPAVAALGGLVFGHGLVLAWQMSQGVSGSRLKYAEGVGIPDIVVLGVKSMPTLAFTWLAAATLLVGWMFLNKVMPRWRIALAFVIAVAPSFVALDETRVGAVTVWPVLAWLVITSYQQDPARTKRAVSFTLLVACVFPALVIWEGVPALLTWWLAPVATN